MLVLFTQYGILYTMTGQSLTVWRCQIYNCGVRCRNTRRHTRLDAPSQQELGESALPRVLAPPSLENLPHVVTCWHRWFTWKIRWLSLGLLSRSKMYLFTAFVCSSSDLPRANPIPYSVRYQSRTTTIGEPCLGENCGNTRTLFS